MMCREDGIKEFPIWLLRDSNPKNWHQVLKKPFDSRHPIRHNIWGSILEVMQDEVFNTIRNRIDTSNIYIRNAIKDPNKKPKNGEKSWSSDVEKEILQYRRLCTQYNPKIILCFGAFAFEFARRANSEQNIKRFKDWNTRSLGSEFRNRITNFNIDEINVIPLLHRSIAGGKFIESHNYFCNTKDGNYFEYVGKELSKILLNNKEIFKVWKI